MSFDKHIEEVNDVKSKLNSILNDLDNLYSLLVFKGEYTLPVFKQLEGVTSDAYYLLSEQNIILNKLLKELESAKEALLSREQRHSKQSDSNVHRQAKRDSGSDGKLSSKNKREKPAINIYCSIRVRKI